jgi:predicted dehydrogenase
MIDQSMVAKKSVKLTYGMVGGGPDAFIGDVHRSAIRIDDLAMLVAGAFSRDAEKSIKFGMLLGLDSDRLYTSYEEMAEKESEREDGIDFVVVVTPNASHFPICKTFLSHGIHVVSDKPLTIEYGEAQELVTIARENDLLFGVTYTYTGYPTVKQISHMIKAGMIGEIRFVNAEYPQEWLAGRSEDSGNRQAAWRTDPAFSGKSNCVGDIGSHIENMVATMTGLRISRLSARLDTFVDGRLLDDNATIMVDYVGGARGLYWCSQIAIGSQNALRVRICGSTGTIEWFQEDPDHFRLMKIGEPMQTWSRGRDSFVKEAQDYSRIPSGHPEGVYEAFANIYRSYIRALSKKMAGEQLNGSDMDFPTGGQGADGVQFINKCVESSLKGSAWVTLEQPDNRCI